MPILSVDCHSHTTRYSACARVDPEQAVTLARARGLDVLVLTEHHVRWSEAELTELRKAAPGLTLLSGMELTLAEGYDVVLLGPDVPQTLEPRMLLEELQPLRAGWGEHFVFVAHPFRYLDYLDLDLHRVLQVVDGIEMTSCNIFRAGAVEHNGGYVSDRAELYEQARQRQGLVPVYNSDSHTEPGVGAVAMDLETAGPIRTMGDLVAALRTTTPSEAQDPGLVAQVLALQSTCR